MRIVFMGTPDFAVPSLVRLIEGGYPPVAVVTAPDKPRGRGRQVSATPVKQVAERNRIPVIQPADLKDPEFAKVLSALEPDLFVVVAFRILPAAVFTIPKKGSFNLHASLLPAFRGAAPINHAIMSGAEETGVTTFFLREKVDTGDMILQRKTPIGPDETAGELHDRLMELGAEAVLDTVRLIESGDTVSRPQDHTKATPAPKIFPADCEINWAKSARDLHNFIRALSPHPGAWTQHRGRLLKVFLVRPHEGEAHPGRVLSAAERLVVGCGDGALELIEVQLEGRRRQPTGDFLRGYEIETGDLLGA